MCEEVLSGVKSVLGAGTTCVPQGSAPDLSLPQERWRKSGRF